MLIRDTVTAQERLSGLQPKCDRNELFDKKKNEINKQKAKKCAKKVTHKLLWQ